MKIKRIIQQLLRDERKLNDLVKSAFSAVDSDGSGEIDDTELFNILCRVKQVEDSGEPLTLGDVRAAMSELDTYNDGLITFDEFKALVMAALQYLYQKEANN